MRGIEAIGKLPNAACRYYVLPLHASLQEAEQRKVFASPPRGLRKVVVATDVAETSITVADIVCVIDSGRVKETSRDADGDVVRLQEHFVSRVAAEQRCKQAGRVRNGYCFKMYRWLVERERMAAQPEPELQRVPLEQTCLAVKAMGVNNVRAFLETAPRPPAGEAVDEALAVLERMGATADGDLTALGQHMALIPGDLRTAKLAVYGVLFGCVERAVTVASILSGRSPFETTGAARPGGRRDESETERRRFAGGQGDLLADCRAWEQWDAQRRGPRTGSAAAAGLQEWCRAHHLSPGVLHDIAVERTRLLESLRSLGFLARRAPAWLGRNNNNDVLLRGLIAGALAPRIARIERPPQRYLPLRGGALAIDPQAERIRFTTDGGAVSIDASSTVAGSGSFAGEADFLAFLANERSVVRECTRE